MLELYADNYADARARFLAQARSAGASLESLVHPEVRGPAGESLAMDSAWFGPRDASRVLVMLAGTHGSEGYAVSPVMGASMVSGRLGSLPADTGVLLVHAVNPYGYAHLSRTNENNVDLNRNFVDFSKGAPKNPGYTELHPLLCPVDTSEHGRQQAQAGIERWIASHGQDAFFAAVFNGQYEEPRGLLYGGQRREWSNHALERLTANWLGQAGRIAFIDWHTGLGEYGQPFFLCFNDPGTPQWEQCCDWWGRERIEHQAGFSGARRPDYSGLVFHGVRRFCAHADFAGAVIEFGTTPPETTIQGLQLDNQLRFAADKLDAVERTALRAQAMQSFCPSDPAWREGVVQAGQAIIEQALQGLSRWDAA